LTATQLRALRFIGSYQMRQGCPPTRRQLCTYMGWTAPSTAHELMGRLERDGFLGRVAGRHGILSLTTAGWSALTSEEVAA